MFPPTDTLNRWFTAIVAGVGGIGGSAISFLVSGALIAALIGLARREYALVRDRGVLAITIVFAIFVVGEFALALVHFDDRRNLAFAATRLSFLAFLPLYSRYALSRRAQLMSALEWGSAAGAAAAFVLSVIQLSLYTVRVSGSAGNPGPFALVTLIMFTISLSGYLRGKGNKRKRLAMAAGALLAAGCVLMSGMRGLWPGLVIVPAILLWFNRTPGTTHLMVRRSIVTTTAAATIALAAGYALMPERFTALERDIDAVFNAGNYNNSLGQRVLMWRYGIDLFLQSPVFGYGRAQMQAYFPQYTLSHFGFSFGYTHLHNAAIDAMARGGMVALVLIVAVLFAPIVFAARHRRDALGQIGFALMVAIVADYALAGTFGIMFGHDIQDFLFVFMITMTAYFVFGEAPDNSAADRDRPSDRPSAPHVHAT